MKRVVVVRYGGYGDAIMIQPLLKALKDDGFHVTLNAEKRTQTVLRHDPNIDEFLMRYKDDMTPEEQHEYWDNLREEYDLFINMSSSIEQTLLPAEGSPEYEWSHERRHKECNFNYYDFTMACGGYRHIKGVKPNLYFTKKEHKAVKKMIGKYRYVVLWSLSGSSYHKAYPYADYVMEDFLTQYPEAIIITVGDYACTLLEWEHPRILNRSGKLSIRESMLMTQYVDMVVGTETGLMVAAACYDTPKVIMLSHASEENLTKYWTNTKVIIPDADCHPCHQLHYTRESCKQSEVGSPICTDIKPNVVLNAMEEIYKIRKVA